MATVHKSHIPAGHIGALSLWQPWASLVLLGAKGYETRDYGPPAYWIGTRIAIHATSYSPGMPSSRLACQAMARGLKGAQLAELPRGHMLGTVKLVAAFQVDSIDRRSPYSGVPRVTCEVRRHGSFVTEKLIVNKDEDLFGLIAPRRWLWEVTKPRPLPLLEKCSGAQRVWYWRPPELPMCVECGCTQNDACDDGLGGGCSWARPGLCSVCAVELEAV